MLTDSQYYTVRETAGLLRISVATLYARAKDGAITFRKDGGRTLVSGSEIKRYIDARPTMLAAKR